MQIMLYAQGILQESVVNGSGIRMSLIVRICAGGKIIILKSAKIAAAPYHGAYPQKLCAGMTVNLNVS